MTCMLLMNPWEQKKFFNFIIKIYFLFITKIAYCQKWLSRGDLKMKLPKFCRRGEPDRRNRNRSRCYRENRCQHCHFPKNRWPWEPNRARSRGWTLHLCPWPTNPPRQSPSSSCTTTPSPIRRCRFDPANSPAFTFFPPHRDFMTASYPVILHQ